MNKDRKYTKFNRPFETGGSAPWLNLYIEKKQEISEIFFVCDICNKEEKIDITDKTDISKVTLEQEQIHKKCGLN